LGSVRRMTCSAASGARSFRSGLGLGRTAVGEVAEERAERVARGAGVRAGRVGLGMERGGRRRCEGRFLFGGGGRRGFGGRCGGAVGRRERGCLLCCGQEGGGEGVVEIVEVDKVF